MGEEEMNWKSKIEKAIEILDSDMVAEDKVARTLGFLVASLRVGISMEHENRMEKADWFETIKGDCGTHKIDEEEDEEEMD
tara:strand:+ start:316 stop:558 length:243 start_codon:yes stop_codon:yes gene_type:complete